ncbi:heme oxygenase [Azospirillum lipoferum]|uniref:Biliverdin-producing heme oxygenase n=1 Tax=Azospirillum lipoferum TaxID=193 RepID=A0A5A9GTU2_AZOLI|nr:MULTISPECIES: biliverdin-producing heme oxygenase [Azospirillum]KAA0597860.1 biliverdin-producing heme oxygenase [Azospirillum lipoferum]MCP1609999.1 heme oxygenase [Azospirillum lipoferum]MDW5534508.1 biliverdin-producing heme oxygenase [Azospirillum sp. NL1]
MGPARQALRAATRESHDRLDKAAVLQPLVRPDITQPQYARALAVLYGFNAPVERELGEDAARLDLLRDDLRVLGADPDALPEMEGLPPLDSAPARLAARYVLDGSAHGGRAMLPGITRALGYDARRGARFLASDGLDMAGAWKALMVRLERELADPAALAAACATAAGLFAALERWTAEQRA